MRDPSTPSPDPNHPQHQARLSPLFSWRGAVCSPYGPPSSTTRLVLLALSLHMNEKGGSCHPSQLRLQKETGLSNKAVIEHLEKARQSGWITRNKAQLGGQRWRRHSYRAAVPTAFWERVVEGYHAGEYIAQELVHSSRVQMPVEYRQSLDEAAGTEKGGERGSPAPEKGGEAGSPRPEKGGERGSPPTPEGGEAGSPAPEKGGEPHSEGGEPHSEGGERGSHKDDKKDDSKDDKERNKQAEKSATKTRTDPEPRLPFLNDTQQSHAGALGKMLQQYEPRQALELVNDRWALDEPIEGDSDDAEDLRHTFTVIRGRHEEPAAAWRRFACAAWLTGKYAEQPTVAYLQRVLRNFYKHEQRTRRTGQRPERQPWEEDPPSPGPRTAGRAPINVEEQMEAAAEAARAARKKRQAADPQDHAPNPEEE